MELFWLYSQELKFQGCFDSYIWVKSTPIIVVFLIQLHVELL